MSEAGPPPAPTRISPARGEMVKASQAHRIGSLSFLIPINTHWASNKARSSGSLSRPPQHERPPKLLLARGLASAPSPGLISILL